MHVETIGGAHFATFPVNLIMPCILAGSEPGDTILDSFGGSGTVAVASAQVGRKSFLVDINADYIDIARRRITSAYEQVPMFAGVP